MGRPYAREIRELNGTAKWALGIDVGEVVEFVGASHGCPLLAVGSGGSVAAAHLAALLHRRLAYGPSRHATPMELRLDEPSLSEYAVLLMSASGRNRDVLTAALSAVEAGVRALASISTRESTPLATAVAKYHRGYTFSEKVPSGKDGFLATNSLVATSILLARGYGIDLRAIETERAVSTTGEIGHRPTAVVLHAGWSSPVATDLESRLHESTLMNVQSSDYRNFGHGRHLWLDRRGAETIVVALLTPETKSLAERTLRYFPESVPIVRIETSADGPAGTIGLLCSAMRWTGEVAERQAIDPGRPHVPSFGKKLFHLGPLKAPKTRIPVPVQRKLSRMNVTDLALVDTCEMALEGFTSKLSNAVLGAVVLDYDGTLCSTRERTEPLSSEIESALSRLLAMGIKIGIATGRGRSVREPLRAALPEKYWESVVIGYYSGSDLAPLTCSDSPNKKKKKAISILEFERILERDRVIARLGTYEVRPNQIMIRPRSLKFFSSLQTYLLDIVYSRPSRGYRMQTSGHSIDIVAPRSTKLSLVSHLELLVKPSEVLTIGDQGGWPGNDCQLLGQELSLCVDQVSCAVDTCWNLCPPGVIGPQAALRYLDAIDLVDGEARFDVSRFGGGCK